MKIVGIIISIFILALNAIPCCWDSCEDEPNKEYSKTEESCSPFLSCGNCAGFVLQEDVPQIKLYAQTSLSEIEFPGPSFYSEFSESIWQPPREIMIFRF
jgi:hypothetical protein